MEGLTMILIILKFFYSVYVFTEEAPAVECAINVQYDSVDDDVAGTDAGSETNLPNRHLI